MDRIISNLDKAHVDHKQLYYFYPEFKVKCSFMISKLIRLNKLPGKVHALRTFFFYKTMTINWPPFIVGTSSSKTISRTHTVNLLIVRLPWVDLLKFWLLLSYTVLGLYLFLLTVSAFFTQFQVGDQGASSADSRTHHLVCFFTAYVSTLSLPPASEKCAHHEVN